MTRERDDGKEGAETALVLETGECWLFFFAEPYLGAKDIFKKQNRRERNVRPTFNTHRAYARAHKP